VSFVYSMDFSNHAALLGASLTFGKARPFHSGRTVV